MLAEVRRQATAGSIAILDLAFEEAMRFLNGEQYDHVADQFRELGA